MSKLSQEDILKLAVGIPKGETEHGLICPYCGGGKSGDRSLSVTVKETGAILYKCHRASCSAKGIVGSRGTGGLHTSIGSSVFNPAKYTGKLAPLNNEDFEFFEKRYGLPAEYIINAGWARADDFNNVSGIPPVVMPIISPKGAIRGICLRRMESETRKQIRVYKETPEPLVCWYRNSNRPVVVVEDQISALKAAKYCTSAALMGTALNYDKIEEIAATAENNPVYLALDKDASKKVFDYFLLYRAVVPKLSVLLLDRDIKDMPDEDILALGGPFK